MDENGASCSAVSRRAEKESGKQLEEFYSRHFSEQEFVVIMINGIGVSGVENIVALGVDVWGKKQVLGVRKGTTENTVVCTELLEDSVERGLPSDADYPVVINGAPASAF